jgi:hypothetical protein
MNVTEIAKLRVGSAIKHIKSGKVGYIVLPTDYPYSIKTVNGVQCALLVTTFGTILSTNLLPA